MTRVLGLDLGTASIGWALLERENGQYRLLDHDSMIFQEGVGRDKGNEIPMVAKRTSARALRRLYYRRRLRKIELLKVLISYGLCPKLSDEALALWRKEKEYPKVTEFLEWQRTDDNVGRNPYYDRYLALNRRLDFEKQSERYRLGRALYHLAQRRGFWSNRKSGEDVEGKVKEGISGLTGEMQQAGCRYLGEYFYKCYTEGKKIRSRYTSRIAHYEAEFEAICEQQALPDEWRKRLHRAIFYQRPLKSQKGLVGKCTFEKSKSRCPISHPCFEEFRMLQFLNNVRVSVYGEAARGLTTEEKERAFKPFMRKSKPHFDFADIAKAIVGKSRFLCKGELGDAPYAFNYARYTSVSGCPVTAALSGIFGDDWLNGICSQYLLAEGKSAEQILSDVWHVLFSFDDPEKLQAWAAEQLQLPAEQAKAFASIKMPQGYAALSLNAINKILPLLREGYRYDEAVFLANLPKVLSGSCWADEERRQQVARDITVIVESYRSAPTERKKPKEQAVREYLMSCGVDEAHLSFLYHPSKLEAYPVALPDVSGRLRLGSPRIGAVRNPMAMRALFRLRALINRLLDEGRIDRDTVLHIEFSRELNDGNRRKAIRIYQDNHEKERNQYAEAIRTLTREQCHCEIEPSEDDILKYQLWTEQNHMCLYTGKEIGICEFIGRDPKYDIEHTVPRSRGGDDSQMNKTLCEVRFNRETKGAKLPSELSSHADILARIEDVAGWPQKIEDLRKKIEGLKQKSKRAATKEEKDKAICARHVAQMELDYLRGKCERFTMEKVPEGFSNRQGVDIGIIGKYACLYLGTVFPRIYTVKGATTAAFRKMWGLQSDDEKKSRANHAHHCIDAITIACIGRREYDLWAQHMRDEERYELGEGARPVFPKPWPTFTEDVKAVAEELLIPHHTPDNVSRQTRRKLRVRGKIQRGPDGQPLYEQGDGARFALHDDTFYGAIKRDGEVKYVISKALGLLTKGQEDKIVDDVVREKVKAAIREVGFKEAMDVDKHTIWMNEEKRIPIRKVRIYADGVKNPLSLKPHRDLSEKAYKRDYHVQGGGNYCMAIYEGTDEKGKTKRSFRVFSNLEIAQYYKRRRPDGRSLYDVVPVSDKEGLPLKYAVKVGTMVLFYENSPEELHEVSSKELVKRLYKVYGLSEQVQTPIKKYGVIKLKFHQEARSSKELGKEKNGVWKIGEDYRPRILLLHTQLKAYVEGVDFELTLTGEIRFKHHPSC